MRRADRPAPLVTVQQVPDEVERDKPRRRRIVLWLLLPALVVVGTVGLLGVVHRLQDPGPFHVGTCFQIGKEGGVVAADGLRKVVGRAKIVDCSAAHDARMTRKVRHASDCATEGASLKSRGYTYCVALSD
jgi:hypothetical protein